MIYRIVTLYFWREKIALTNNRPLVRKMEGEALTGLIRGFVCAQEFFIVAQLIRTALSIQRQLSSCELARWRNKCLVM